MRCKARLESVTCVLMKIFTALVNFFSSEHFYNTKASGLGKVLSWTSYTVAYGLTVLVLFFTIDVQSISSYARIVA